MIRKYLFIVFFLHLVACSFSDRPADNEFVLKQLQMDERVVAYVGGVDTGTGFLRIATDIDELKKWFPKALNEEHFDSGCDYFSINLFAPGLLEYFVVYKDSTSDSLFIYDVFPADFGSAGDFTCRSPEMPATYGFLICDKEGGLKDKVRLSPITYSDPTWNCAAGREKPPFFEFRE